MTYTILKTLVLPPGILILLLIFAFFATKGVLARLSIFVPTAVLTLLSLPIVAAYLMNSLEPYPALITETPIPDEAQAIIVLSSEAYPDALEYGGDTIGRRTLARVRYGAFLAKKTGLPLYVTGGGSNDEHPAIGKLMAESLEHEFGIQVAGIEDQSGTTRENAELSVPMLRKDNIEHALIVTHAWHMPRAMASFQRQGLSVTAAPTMITLRLGARYRPQLSDWLVSAYAFQSSYFALHEYLGQAWYQLREQWNR